MDPSPPDLPNGGATTGLHCPACRSLLKVGRKVASVEEKCPVCRAEVRMTIFPRFFADSHDEEQGEVVAEGEASCSYFPELKAEKICDECGGFLSSRASLVWDRRDLCLPCLHRLREVEKSRDYLARSSVYDKRALALVTWLAPLSLFTAPLALFLLFRYRGAAPDFVPRGGAIWWTAFTLALLWLVAWVVFIVAWISLILENFT